MGWVICFIFLTNFLPFLVIAQQTDRNGSVPLGASLTATNNVTPWLSPSGDFAFGFQKIQGKDKFVLSIWYDKIASKNIIWYPQTNATVSPGSTVELTNGRGLVLSDLDGREVWTSGSRFSLAYGFMNDTGNFVLVGNDSSNVWESFGFPTDTVLPGQVMEKGGVLNSRLSETNFSRGRFQLRLLQDGNLVLNTRDIASDFAYGAYYVSGTYDASNQSNSGEQVVFDETGFIYIIRRNGQRFDLTPNNTRRPSGDYYHRVTLDPDGVLTQYSLPKNPTGNTAWENIWSESGNICARIDGIEGSRACGFNNVCNRDTFRPNCECPRGFSLLDPNDPNGDCKPDYSPSCEEGESNFRDGVFDFIELNNVNWPQSDYKRIRSVYEEDCKKSCEEDCFCSVIIFNKNECWKKQLPLVNGRRGSSEIAKAFLKVRKDDRLPQSPPRVSGEKKDQTGLVRVGLIVLCTLLFVIFVLLGVILAGFFHIYKNSARNPYPSSKVVDTNLTHFTYQELVEATNGFKNELGKGAFGIVYNGTVGTNIVAVKKLDRVFHDSEKEFENEVNAIARTHHKNLVRLLGYCNEGENRLLIYEYMENGTLAMFLFGDSRPSWKQRTYIALGIAKGLAYLHEECSTQVIHCDIKPQNILLDEYFNAKISDFGLAKLLMINQSQTSTGIRGTKGYVAPEWFRNTSVTVKVDVYSFGVLLLEIISCRKSLHFESGNEDRGVLTDWAWDCYQERRLDVLVEDDMEAFDDYDRLSKFVMVGLWCVQENPSLRPTMRRVIQMLEGVVEVTEPPCPFPLSVTFG